MLLALALSAVPFLAPVLSETWRVTYGEHIVGPPFVVALIVALGARAREARDGVGRRFWTLFALGFLAWLAALILFSAGWTIDTLMMQRVTNNLPYLLFYAALAVALEVHPRVRSDSGTARLRALDRIAAAVFLFGLLMYFLVLPGMVREDALWTSLLALFAALDVYIVLRLFGLRQMTQDAEWRATYSWLLGGAVIWGLGDVVVMLMDRGLIPDPGYGNLFDLIWPLACTICLVATRAGAYQPESRPPARPVQEPLGMGPAVVYAVLFPFLHVLYYRFAAPDEGVGPARAFLVLGFTAVLAVLAFTYHWWLQIENRRATDEEERARERLAHLAFHDELTGLPSRDVFQDHLRLAIADARRYRRRCAVLFCDLDRFKVINDSLGHEAGDQVLVSTAERLLSSVRTLDTVARFGGDEFTIVLHGIGDAIDAARLAEKMLASLSEPLLVQGKKHVLTASIGIAVFPEDGEDVSTLRKHADTAMYQAKLQGRNTYRLFTEAMNEAAEERLAIEQGLRTARMDENFVVFYQPIVRIATGEPMGYEALLRWNHPERGFIAPGSFIDVAEQTGLIVPIGQWVLETACTWALKMESSSAKPPSIAVNISARQLQEPAFVNDVMAIVERTGLPASRLHLEITEPIALDSGAAAPILAELRGHGIRIAVDDFGTGFAALSRLKDFPVDTVKIDRSFVKGIEADTVGETIVGAIVTMGSALGFSVVAEGVETKAEFDAMKELGCDAVQGFYLQAPAPAAEIEEALAQR